MYVRPCAGSALTPSACLCTNLGLLLPRELFPAVLFTWVLCIPGLVPVAVSWLPLHTCSAASWHLRSREWFPACLAVLDQLCFAQSGEILCYPCAATVPSPVKSSGFEEGTLLPGLVFLGTLPQPYFSHQNLQLFFFKTLQMALLTYNWQIIHI